ncbi:MULTISPECIES: hypothetical protein [unclassified Ensifer]|uniref:hypothetical protein n=1 Tax=unclassified Ensifer TaxID=2633371 RepID=UPI000709BAAA|nr:MULTISPECIES: hypothetical protein [unclassified Ensifer]KQW62717.1 hypothetical protein ASD02_00870 [Ensifer sp. Root1252]KRC83537.1 hypothetical protein ASE32_00865 [Ensifer sp. Root231]
MENIVAEKVKAAARWLSEQTPVPPHVISILKTKFEITAVQAAQACTMANQYRSNGRHSGEQNSG